MTDENKIIIKDKAMNLVTKIDIELVQINNMEMKRLLLLKKNTCIVNLLLIQLIY